MIDNDDDDDDDDGDGDDDDDDDDDGRDDDDGDDRDDDDGDDHDDDEGMLKLLILKLVRILKLKFRSWSFSIPPWKYCVYDILPRI